MATTKFLNNQSINVKAVIIAVCAVTGCLAQFSSSPSDSILRGCVPPKIPDPQPKGVLIPELAAGRRPNFIVILTDDQGWDDIGLHHPQGHPAHPNTPNLDKFLETSTKFDNFYVAPLCAQSRAALLTGRSHAKTGTMLVNGGYDFMNKAETTAGAFMQAAGYTTAHFGKWHNGRSLGYEPWHVGFQESWHPEQYIHLDNLMQHNGEYVQTYGLMEQVLMDKMLTFLDSQQNSNKPFFLYYAPNAIHRGSMRPGEGPKWTRPSPEYYKAKYKPLAAAYNISGSTIEVWAMLEYMDDVLGRLFEYIKNSSLKQDTYIMICSDNGSELFLGEIPSKQWRMPSGMQGYKRDVLEGGVRSYLAVQGPGVQAGVIDSTLTDITDILPTMAALAGIQPDSIPHMPWDGMNIANLLLTGSKKPVAARRGTSQATQQQLDRFVFSLGPLCWDANAVPQLASNRRQILRPQGLIDFETGGRFNRDLLKYYNMSAADMKGFDHCVGVRHQTYKWIGHTNKVYKFEGDSHIELPCNEVPGSQAQQLAQLMREAAKFWWGSVVHDPNSFLKPTFYLGLAGWSVTNVFPDGAHDKAGHVELLPNGAKGFKHAGDRLCFATEVFMAGTYEAVVIYTAAHQATFKLSVGKWSAIAAGAAPALTVQLPALSVLGGQYIGQLKLEASTTQETETCFEMVANPSSKEAITYLGVIRFTRLDPYQPVSVASSIKVTGPGPLATEISPPKSLQQPRSIPLPVLKPNKPGAVPVAVKAPGLDMSSNEMRRVVGLQDQELEKGVRLTQVQAYKRSAVTSNKGVPGSLPARPQPNAVEYGEVVLQQPPQPSAAVKQPSAAPQKTSITPTALLALRWPLHHKLNATAAMQRTEHDAYAAAVLQRPEHGRHTVRHGNASAKWQQLRAAHLWPDGQHQLESMFSPYQVEGIGGCLECQPLL